MADELTKIKKTRAVTKSSITQLIKKIEDLWVADPPNIIELEESLAQLEQKKIDLKNDDDKILNLISDLDELGKDAIASMEYYDKITLWSHRINKKIKENVPKINPPQIHMTSPIMQVENSLAKIKLPTLKIEKFSGDINSFQEFWNSFKATIHENESLSSTDKMIYLKSFLGGDAYNVISGLTICEKNYEAAIELLHEQFGRKDLLINNHINILLALKPVTNSNDLSGLRKLFDTVQVQIRNLQSLDMQANNFDTLLIPIILKALPHNMSLEFNRQIIKKSPKDASSNIDELLLFIRTELQAREKQNQNYTKPYFDKHSSKYNPRQTVGRENITKSFQVEAKKENLFDNCFYCDSRTHSTSECKNVSISRKKEKIKKYGLCFICLGKHLAKECRSNQNFCSSCKKGKHHISICNNLFGNENEKANKKEISQEDNTNNPLVARVTSNNVFDLEKREKQKSVIDPLQIIQIECGNKIISGVVDSGTQISIIRSSCVPEYFKNPCGSVILQSAFGHQLKAPLVNIPLSIAVNNVNSKVPPEIFITCAMVDNLVNDLLLSITAYNELSKYASNKSQSNEINESFAMVNCTLGILNNNEEENDIIDVSCQSEQNNQTEQNFQNNASEITPHDKCESELSISISQPILDNQENVDIKSDPTNSNNDSDNFVTDSDKFKYEQKNDSSLKQCWEDAKNEVNNYFIQNNLLYHRDKILGETVYQLVVPETRRAQLLELAHSSPWGGHLRKKKTVQRLKYSFFWPKITSDVGEFCEKCLSCQLRAKPKQFDEVPITPVTRPDEPFQIINMDIIGPIEPSSAGYKYVLTAIDQCTRWPEAVCLKSISAKPTCEALLQIFSRTGIPKLIASDQGPNFTSALTQEFMKCLGTAPRFSVPGYPQSNGLVERWNGVLKGMIHHTIREHSRNWHKHIPFLLWAYREVPNATTDVSPFQMLYGRRPTGPLSILKSTWTDETPLPCGQLGSVTNYLNDLKMKLQKAAEHAGISCASKQQSYAYYHNRKTRHKEFKQGDQVIVLTPDSNHKLYARWTAPATIIEKKSPYSYLVQLPDNSVKHIHANKIRELKVQTTHIGVIYDADIDFGDIENIPCVGKENSRSLGKDIELDHLSLKKRKQLVDILNKHANLQSGIPKIANVGEHTIRLKPDSQPKRQKPYRIPEALKNEVDRQIEELLELGLIEHSESEYAHPVVCVAKKDGSVRLCVDYRFLNSQTEMDSFPMTNATDLIYKVASAKFITLLDLLKGYWQIRLNEKCKYLTSFVTHRGQYAFTVMPFGLRNAAATFQRTMNRVLVQHKEYAETYIDDVVIFSNEWNEHLKHLESVLDTLEKTNFTVNFKKCIFARPQIKFLGHIVGSGSHAPDPEKVTAIQNLETPKSKKDVKSVLGLLSYYRSYVPSFSDIARPLIELIKKRAPNNIIWSDECNKAFNELKQAICNSPTCYSPDFRKPFIIYSDASYYAIGACLAQEDDNNQEHPIAFVSKKLSSCQEGYATIEKEAYAVIFALKKFEHYIYGTQVIVVSDHNPLKFLTDCAPQSARLQRWALALQRFQAQITYRRGKLHINADSLSRLRASHWT